MTLSLPQDMVDKARREREESLLGPIVSGIDNTIKQGMSGLQSIAQGAAEQVAPVVKLLQGGTLELPTLDDLTPQWMRDQYEPKLAPAQPAATVQPQQQAPAAASGMPQAMPQQTATAAPAAGEIDNSSRESFIRTAYPYALEAADGDEKLANQLIATAISENGKVGTGRSLGEMGFNVGGIQGVEGTAGSFVADDAGRPRQFAAYRNLSEGFRAVRDLVSGGRYAQAAENYRQTGDIDRYWREINEAGYSETPTWQDLVGSIRRDQVEPLTRGVQTRPQGPQQTTPPQAEQTPAARGQQVSGFDVGTTLERYAGGTYTFGGGRDQNGLGVPGARDTDCSGFVSSVWREQGIAMPAHTDAAYEQLRGLGAAQVSEQDAQPGDVVFYMGAGYGGNVTYHMGIYAGPGQVLDASSRGGQGVRIRPLTHAGGPEDIVILRDPRVNGRVDPRRAEAPPEIQPTGIAESPLGERLAATGGASLNAVPAAAPGRTAPAALAGVASTPAGAPPAPWETAGASDGAAPLMLKENDETAPMGGGDAMLPGDGGFAPMQGSAPGMEGSAAIYDARDTDSGPRESRPAPILPTDPTVSDLAYTQSPTGMSYGPIQQGEVQGPQMPVPGPDLSPGGTPIRSTREMNADRPYDPRQYDEGRREADPLSVGARQVRPPSASVTEMQVPRVPSTAEMFSNVANGLTPGGRPWSSVLPGAVPQRGTGVAPAAFIRDMIDLPGNVGNVPDAALASVYDWAQEVRKAAADTGQAYDEGRTMAALVNGLWTGLQAFNLPWKMAEYEIDALLPDMATGNLSMGQAITNIDILNDIGKLIAWGVKVTPKVVTALRNGASPEYLRNVATGVAGAARSGAETLGRGLQGVGREVAGQLLDLNPAMTPRMMDGGPGIGRAMGDGGALGTPGVGPNRAAQAATQTEPAPTFYSQLRRTLDEKMPNRASGAQIEGILRGSPVKPDEIAWTGLDDFLRQNRGRPVTKQEVLDFLDQNAVQIEEVVKGQPLIRWRAEGDALVAAEAPTLRVVQEADGSYRVQHDGRVSPVPFATVDEAKQAAQDIATDPRVGLLPKPDQTRYGQYTLPGGENYRELLLTMPSKMQKDIAAAQRKLDSAVTLDELDAARAEMRALTRGDDPQRPYRSSHWDEPNVLAHVRFNERVAPDGKRVLLIEEIQSDWHQAGRKQGYNATPRELTADELELQALNRASFQRDWTPGERARAEQLRAAGVGDTLAAWATAKSKPLVPDAPFKKTWPELAIKRMIRWAAENGFDRIAWPPGSVHAERFGLARQVDNVTAVKGRAGISLTVQGRDGRNIMDSVFFRPEEYGKIEETLGQDLARKIIGQAEPEMVYRGDDLMMGGDGMKGFYDKIVPETAQKIGKKFGARVGTSEVALEQRYRVTNAQGRVVAPEADLTPDEIADWRSKGLTVEPAGRTQPVHSMDITPQMRESVVYQGQPQFAALPFDPTSAAAGGAAGAMSEGEDGEQGDPLRTAAGIGLGAFGARMVRQPGRTVATGLKPGQRYEFRVRVIPLRELITSHLDNLAENPRFLGALQPRVRSRAASRVQIDKMVQAFDPEQVLMDTHRVDSGPMIVGPDMMVESGNGRAIALRRLAQENPEAYAEYVQALREELPYYGLTDDALEGIDQPVLVRERVTPLDDAERARFASEANAPTAAQMSSMEQALADARNIGDGPLGRIVVGEDQTIDEALLSPENGAFVRAFMATVPDTERGKMLEANGNLSVTGLARVKAALLARTYPGAAGERVATAIVESTDAGLRNVQNTVMGSLPSMARVEGLVASGEVDAGLSLADDIAAAVDVYARLKRAGILVGDYLQQTGMFGGRETTPLQDAILGYLNDNARAPRRLRALLEGYAREVEATAGAAGDMFGGPSTAATKEELLDGVLRRLGAAPGADQGADLGRAGAGSNVLEGSARRPIQIPGADTGAQAGRGAGSPSLIDDVAAAETLTPEEQIARLQAENDRLRAERRGGGRRQQAQQPAQLGDANLPPVADDLIPQTGGEAGRLQVEGAPQPIPRPGPVGDILPRTGGPEGTLAREGAPEPQPRPTPIPRDVLPPTGGPEGVLRQPVATEPQTGPTPFARPTPIPEDAIPATGGPEIRLRVEEDRKAVEQLMADSAGARRYDEQQRRQISEATARYAEDVRTLSQRIEAERAAGNTPDRLMAERAAVANRLHATMLLAEGRRGPAARAFREADRQAALLQRDPKRAVAQMHQRFGGQENAAAAADEYTRMVEDGATPIQLARFWAGVERGKITGADLFGLYRRFNMLSGPRTIEVNALSGALNLGYEVVSQAVGQTARGRGAEAAAEFAAPFKAMGRAFNNLAETMWHGVSAEQAARGDIPRTLSSRTDNRAAKGVLTAMEVPDRFNAAVDQFYRTMTEDWAATMLAHKRARADGLTPRSDGWADAVAKHLQEIRDDVDVLPEIKRMADHVTFAEEPGGIGRGLEEFRRRAPLVANVLFPFIRTPYNIASRAVDLSPLGVVRTGAEVLTGRGRGRENVSRRVRDNALGLAAAYWAYDQAQRGNVTGAGPDDPEKQAMLRATGWQPYSVKIGDQYWSYANFAPFSLALSMGAAAHEAGQYAKPGEADTLSLLGDAATRTAKVVTDMTVLQGVGAVIKSIQDPDRYGGAWLTQFLGSLVPAGSLLNTVGQATDDTLRRAERDTFANQVAQGVQARIPGLRQQVPVAQDPLGRAVPNDQQGAGALNPFRPTRERPDPAIQAFLDAGVDIGKPKDKLTVAPGVAPIELTPAEQRRWNELRGAILAQNVPNVAGSQRYQEAEKLARAKGLQTMLNAAAQAADKQLIAEIGGAEITRRVRGAVEKRRAG